MHVIIDYGYGDQGVQAQINMTKFGGEWQMPSQYYFKEFDIPCGPEKILILFLDTTTLAPDVTERTNEQGGISTETQVKRIQEQTASIENSLQNSNARFKIAVKCTKHLS